MWAPGPFWTSVENLAHTRIRSPDRPARSELLYRLRYPTLYYLLLPIIKPHVCVYRRLLAKWKCNCNWRTLVSAVMNFRVPWNAGNFLTSCKPVSFSRGTLHHGVSKYISHQLTDWRSVLFWVLTVVELVEKFTVVFVNLSFVAVPSLDTLLSRVFPVHNLTTYLFKVKFSIIFHLPRWLSSNGFLSAFPFRRS